MIYRWVDMMAHHGMNLTTCRVVKMMTRDEMNVILCHVADR